MSPRIVVGISGGVDSALAAVLLQERGFEVFGCYLKVVVEGAPCPWADDLPMAHRVAAHLNIPLIVKDVSAEYTRDVLEPMVAAYRAGETPNPDATCNRYVKFDALAAVAREVGVERIATGHYARIEQRSVVHLLRGVDHVQDQSYFLWMLTQGQLAMCEFPLGERSKGDVRAEVKRRGLPNWDRHSTSGVCFLGNVNLTRFLASYAPSPSPQRGEGEQEGERSAAVVTTAGEIIGTVPHPEALTIGQRAPIAGQSEPRYVVATDLEQHRVVVSASPNDPARYTSTIATRTPYWIGETLALPFRCSVRIRHRQEPVPCDVLLRGSASDRSNPGLIVTPSIPLIGVAPGQAVVFTDGDRVLGGAVIDRRLEGR